MPHKSFDKQYFRALKRLQHGKRRMNGRREKIFIYDKNENDFVFNFIY